MYSNAHDLSSPLTGLAQELETLRRGDLWRSLQVMPGTGGTIEDAGRRWINLSSNDYLDLARHSSVKEAAIRAVQEYGCGATASRLVTGHTAEHEQLEAGLARMTGHERSLAFPSGYQTNLAVISALAGPGDIVFSDRFNHASLIDGCRLSRAEIKVFRHCDMEHLASLLRDSDGAGYRRRVIVSESLFSMDGDLAPVAEMHALADAHGALLVIDEAHAIGVFGGRGGGVCQALGVSAEVVLGTLSKSLGSQGGFVAASSTVIDYLINRARPFIYSTGLAPGCAAAASAALALVAANPDLGNALLARAAQFAALLVETGCAQQASASQIQPIILGENAAALRAAETLREAGILVVAIRPPTVPPGTARLRLSISLAHTAGDLEHAAGVIARIAGRGLNHA